MIYNIEFETLPGEAGGSCISGALKKPWKGFATVAFYRRKFDEAGVKPTDIEELEDLKRLPFTTRPDLRDNYPYGMFAVPMDNVVRIHASSGTTGKPTVVGYTARDIQTWSELMARALTAGGASEVTLSITLTAMACLRGDWESLWRLKNSAHR